MSSEQLKISLLKEEEDVKRFRVRVRLENPGHRFRAGMSVQGRFTVDRKGIFVPRDAVSFRAGRHCVRVESEDGITERTVDVGIRREDLIQVAAGVEIGDRLHLW